MRLKTFFKEFVYICRLLIAYIAWLGMKNYSKFLGIVAAVHFTDPNWTSKTVYLYRHKTIKKYIINSVPLQVDLPQ